MALDFTSETKKEYRERLKTLETGALLSTYKALTAVGYNCEGLVTSDGIIIPRQKYIEEELKARGVDVSPFYSL